MPNYLSECILIALKRCFYKLLFRFCVVRLFDHTTSYRQIKIFLYSRLLIFINKGIFSSLFNQVRLIDLPLLIRLILILQDNLIIFSISDHEELLIFKTISFNFSFKIIITL